MKHKPTRAPKKVFVVEDHPVFREGLLQLVRGEKDLKVCGSAKNAAQALKEIARLEPDLVLVDISLPGKSGLQLIKQLRGWNRKVKLLVVSMHDEALYANRVLQAGGDGYIMKEEEPSEIIEAIHDVLNGHIYVSEQVLTGQAKGPRQSRSPQKSHPLNALTDLELEILESLGLGKSNEEIAEQLRLSPGGVGAQCAEMQRKLKLKTVNALIRYAVCWVETGAAGGESSSS